MKIKGDPEIFFLLKTLMDRTGKTAVRFEMLGMDWGPIFKLKFSDQKDEDIFVDVQGVRFIAERKFEPGLEEVELIKIGEDGVYIKKDPCGFW